MEKILYRIGKEKQFRILKTNETDLNKTIEALKYIHNEQQIIVYITKN